MSRIISHDDTNRPVLTWNESLIALDMNLPLEGLLCRTALMWEQADDALAHAAESVASSMARIVDDIAEGRHTGATPSTDALTIYRTRREVLGETITSLVWLRAQD